MKKIRNTKPYIGTINIGLQRGYTGEYYEKSDYINFIKQWQLERTADRKLMFSPAVYEFDFVCGNLTEKHLAIRFVNYPKQTVSKKEFRRTVNDLAQQMSYRFEQNRILVEYTDRTFLFEQTATTDPKIDKKSEV